MSKIGKAVTTASIVAQGPAGVRRILASVAVIVLLGALALAALFGFAAWSARNSTAKAPLPCPPASVGVAYSTRDVPPAAREAVTEALTASGRTTKTVGWDAGEQRDFVIVWSPGSQSRVSASSSPTTLTLGTVPTTAYVRETLGARLAACTASPSASAPAPNSLPAQEPGQGAREGFSWPWERGLSLTNFLILVLAAWWLVGPQIVRALWKALWPARLAVRLAQRAAYRRRLGQGLGGAVYPEPVSPGQRWHEDDEAMHDRRAHRAQIAKGEPARRSALRAAIKGERLAGTGIGPVSLWRRVYRAPAPEGAPETKGV